MAANVTPPLGKKPDKLIRDMLMIELAREVQVPDPDNTARTIKLKKMRLVAIAWVNAAIRGDVHAIEKLADRVDGKVTQPLSGPHDGPIEIDALSSLLTKIPEKDLVSLERIIAPIAAAARLAPRPAGGSRARAASSKR